MHDPMMGWEQEIRSVDQISTDPRSFNFFSIALNLMSIFQKETINSIAETLGISVSDEVAQTLLQDTEYRLREVIHEAVRFMRHSRRNRLSPNDINRALVKHSDLRLLRTRSRYMDILMIKEHSNQSRMLVRIFTTWTIKMLILKN
jgi:histone H3/H4